MISRRAWWVVLGGCLTTVAVAAARTTERGRHVEHRAEYDIGGSAAEWPAVGALLRALGPTLVLMLVLVAVVALVPRCRRRAVTAGLVLVIGNVGALLTKTAVALVVPATHATLPSGHATVALTLSLALLVLTPTRWVSGALAVAGFVAAGGSLAVVVAYWHSPGDALAASALVPLWALLAAVGLRGLDAVPVLRRVLDGPAPSGARAEARPASAGSVLLPLGVGAATAVVTLLGWGFQPVSTPALHRLVGASILVGLPCVSVVVVFVAVRVLRIDGAGSH